MNIPVGILLVNLGTPDAPTRKAVRCYLKEFLWDPRVVDLYRPLWWLILNGVVLNTRPWRAAKLYRAIWTEHGSPLLAITRAQRDALQTKFQGSGATPIHIEIGMRYGNPSIASALQSLRVKGCKRILLFPLYPQYSAASTGSSVDAFAREFSAWQDVPELRTVHDYHDHPAYIAVLAARVREYWAEHGRPEKLLVSFHGYPRRYIDAGDPYLAQCERTAELLAAALALAPDDWRLTFQSQFDRTAWLRPSTVETLQTLPRQGAKRVHVICPGFSADCLETLQENEIENRRFFLDAGGLEFHYIPALNADPDHVTALKTILTPHVSGWV